MEVSHKCEASVMSCKRTASLFLFERRQTHKTDAAQSHDSQSAPRQLLHCDRTQGKKRRIIINDLFLTFKIFFKAQRMERSPHGADFQSSCLLRPREGQRHWLITQRERGREGQRERLFDWLIHQQLKAWNQNVVVPLSASHASKTSDGFFCL